MKIQRDFCKIVANQPITSWHWKMAFTAEKVAQSAKPGQFVHLVCDSNQTLLRRPFTIYKAENSTVEIVYKVVGKGTRALARKKPGEILDVLGPLGNGWWPPSERHRSPVIFVAGGTGVASLGFLGEYLIKNNYINLTPMVFLGAKTKEEILSYEEFKKMGCQIEVSTNDGTQGFKGSVTELLKRALEVLPLGMTPSIYAGGPRAMLQEISKISTQYVIPCQVSLEEIMGCGTGACQGCVVQVKGEVVKEAKVYQKAAPSGEMLVYKRVCFEGPVFDALEVVW